MKVREADHPNLEYDKQKKPRKMVESKGGRETTSGKSE
jgi:hypothetical protein